MSEFTKQGWRTVVGVALSLLTASWVVADPVHSAKCAPIGGSILTNLGAVDPTTTLGTVTGDLEGAVAATILDVTPGDNGTTVFTVQHHFVTASGDEVHVDKAQATAAMVAPGIFGIVSYPVVITGGTGRFKGATGRIDNIGEVDLNAGRTIFRYTGQLCR